MKKKELNLRFLCLSGIFLLICISIRIFYLIFGLDKIYLEFFSGMMAPPLIFYFIVGLDVKKYSFKNLLYLTFSYILFQFIISDSFDRFYFYQNLGILFSILLSGFTFIRRIQTWFLNQATSE